MSAPLPLCRHGLPVLDDCWRCDRGDVLAVLVMMQATGEVCWIVTHRAEWLRAPVYRAMAGDRYLARPIAREEARLEFEEARDAFLDAATEVTSLLRGWRYGSPVMDALRRANDRWQEAQVRRADLVGGGRP